MGKNEQWKSYALLAIVVPLLLIALTSSKIDNYLDLVVPALLFFILYPMLVMGLYMWTTGGDGHRWLNVGMDYDAVGSDKAKECTSYAGMFISIGMVMIMISASGLFVQPILGILGIVVSVIVILYPVVTINAKDGTHKGKNVLTRMTRSKVLTIIAVASVVALIPSCYLMNYEGSYGSVNISLDDTSFSVSAPMFNHTFEYESVDECYLDENFDKGSRVGGYGTATISTGKYMNNEFGRYYLASYTKVSPCIVISYHGDMYAFNQSSAELTHSVYEELSKRLTASS